MKAHVTDLDAILWYRRIESMTLDDLLSRLRRESAPNRKMEMGTAWHAVLENPPEDELTAVEQDGINFIIEAEAEITLPQIREIRAEKTYSVDGVEITLTGGCDGISGNVVTDHKLTAKPDPEGYQSSYQWKAYLDIYGADVFEYILYHAHDKGDRIIISDVAPFRLYRYPGMVDDLMTGLRDYMDFVRKYMPERI